MAPVTLSHCYIIPHLKHGTPLRVPSKKYGPMIQLAVITALLSCMVGGLTAFIIFVTDFAEFFWEKIQV
jgi:hypothetical protein